MAVPYLLSGMFFFEVSSGDEKGIDFYQRGCLRLWCFQSSVLEVAKKYIIAESSFCGSGDMAAFFQKKFDLPAAGKSRWIVVKEANSSQRLGKTSRFFFVVFKKQIGVSKWQRETFFISFSSRCVEVVHRRLWSGILNPPADFSQSSFLKTLLSRTEAASRTLLLSLGKTRGLLLWPNFNHRSGENAGTEAAFFVFRLGCCSGALTF